MARIRGRRGLSKDPTVARRRSAGKPPDLYDSAINTYPRLELWLLLLVFQGMATATAAVLADPEALPELRRTAGAVLGLLLVLLATIGNFIYRHTRGADASSRFERVVLKDGTFPPPSSLAQ